MPDNKALVIGLNNYKGSRLYGCENDAIKWYRRAAAHGHEGAIEALKQLGVEFQD